MSIFPLDTEDEFADAIDGAREPVRVRVKGLENEEREQRAKQAARQDEIADLNERIRDQTLRLHVAEKEEAKAGPYRKELTETDPVTGGETIKIEKTDYVARIARDLKALQTKRRELMDKKSKPAWIEKVKEDVGSGASLPLVPADPIEWRPDEGEGITDGYKREFHALSALRKDEDRIWNAGRTVAEMERTTLAEIDRLAAAGVPGFGGHRRGNSIGHRGPQIATTPQIAWPVTRPGLDATEVPNGPAMIAWLFRDQLKAAAIAEIRARFSDEGAISAADKPQMLADIRAKIWKQREIVEAAYLYARANGIKNLNRPRDTPTEILLGIHEWPKGRAAMVVNDAPPKGDDADDIDFEGNDGNDE